MRRLLLLLLLTGFCAMAPAQQRNRQQQRRSTQQQQRRQQQRQPSQREQLQQRQQQLRQQRQANQQRQRELEQQLRQRMQQVEVLASEMEDNQLTIDSLHHDIDTLNIHIAEADSQLNVLRTELEERRQHYIKSVRYMYRNRRVQNQMMFVLSARNFNQMYRRIRFMNEYTTYQRAQGEAVKQKSEQVEVKLAELNAARASLDTLLAQSEVQQQQLEQRKEEQQRLVAELQREQQTVHRLITQQQREEAELNAQIDRLIAEELERARRAEEERRQAEQRRREEEQRRQQQQQQQQATNNNNSRRQNNRNNTTSQRQNNRNNTNRRRNNNTNTSTPTNNSQPISSSPTYIPGSADQQLTGSFASNKGRLPVPITGSYRVVRGFGPYTLAGVTLQSSGIHLEGQDGAMARCVFDGEVSKIYNPGSGYVVMVRHGRYISVYCNLSEVSVTAGQRVRINQTLGKVGPSHILVFRLQNWDKTLNPKQWISRL